MKNYFLIDIFKIIMATLVVIIHTVDVSNIYAHRVLELAVPFFFLASGFFLEKKCEYSVSKVDTILLWIKRLLSYYLLWTLVYLPVVTYGFIHDGYSLTEALTTFIRQFLFAGSFFYAWHLWYLLASAVGGGIILFGAYKHIKLSTLLMIGILLCIIGVLLDCLHPVLYFKLFLTIKNGVFVGALWLILGMGIYRIRDIIAKNSYMSVGLCIGSLILFLYSGGYVVYLGASALFSLVVIFSNKVKGNTRIGQFLRTESLYIYLIHMIFVALLKIVFKIEDSYIFFLIVLSLSFLFSLIPTTYILSKKG